MNRSALFCPVFLAIAVCLILARPAWAEEEFRTWRDRSGTYEVEAKLIMRGDEKVQLLKRDGRAVTVPVSALSDADQQYLKQSAAGTPNPFAGGTPLPPGTPSGKGLGLLTGEPSVRALPADGRLTAIDFDEPLPPLEPDAPASAPKFQPFACLLEQLDAYAGMSPPILVDPAGPTFAVSVHRVGNAVDPANFGRVYLVRAGEKRPETALDIEPTFLLFDHHAPSGRSLGVLGVNSPAERGGDLVLLDNLAGGKPDALARWHLPGWDRPGFAPKVEFARLLGPHHALVQVNDSVYLWDLLSGEASWKIDRIRAGARLQTSAGGKYLAVPVSRGCRLVDVAKGELLGTVPFPSSLTPEAKFSPSGARLALVAGNQYVVWDLAAAQVAHEGTIDSPCGNFAGWIGERYLLTQLGGLIDPAMGMPLWNYGLPTNNQALTLPGGVVVVDKTQAAALLGLPVPHGPVQQVAERLSEGDERLMALRPGSEVALVIESIPGVDEAAIRTGLQKAVEKAGWRVSPQAPTQVVATITRGDEQKLNFRKLGAPLSGPYETATIKPYQASLVVRQGNQVLWSRSSTNMVPSFLRLEQGESLQQAVTKYERADPAYFERLTIPPRILKPEIRAAVGRSRITSGRWQDFAAR